MASYNFSQGIVPLCVPYQATEGADPFSDITPMAFQRAFWRVRTWTLATTLHWEISGDDGYANAADATTSDVLYGPGTIAGPSLPLNERSLYRLGFAGLVKGTTAPVNSTPVSYAMLDGSTYLAPNLLWDILSAYRWSAYNRARASKYANTELRIRSQINAALTTAGNLGDGNGVGDISSGRIRFADLSEVFPLVWENGAPGTPFFAVVPSTTRTRTIVPLSGVNYTGGLTVSATLVPLAYWEWRDDVTGVPRYDASTGLLV